MTRLDPADYWQLRALDGDLRNAQQQFQLLQQRRQALWQTLVDKYHLDGQKGYVANDQECSLDLPEGGPGGQP